MPEPGRRRSAPASERASGSGGRAASPVGFRLRQTLAGALHLPPDLLLDLPRVTLLGALHLSVENHRGLLDVGAERVSIDTASGALVVLGHELVIAVVREGEITVTGRLSEIRFEEAQATEPPPSERGAGGRGAPPPARRPP